MYYAELLSAIPRPTIRRSDDPFCPDVSGIRGVDNPLAQRLRTFLDVIADISLCHRGNVSATMARLREDEGTLETELYIVFNHEDEAARHCPLYLQSIFAKPNPLPVC